MPGAPRAGATGSLVDRGFVTLFLAALAFFGAGNTVLPVASRYAAGPLGADATGVGVAIGAFAIAALLLRPLVGWASDRYGRRPLLILGASVTVVALLLHIPADTLPVFVLARSVLGVGEAFFFVAAVAALSDMAPPERRGEAINIGSLAVYLGLALGPFLGETILTLSGYHAVWVTAAGMAAAATVLTFFVPETAPGALRQRKDGQRPPRTPLVHRAGFLPGFLLLTGMWGMAGFFAFIPLYATELGMGGAGPALALYAVIVVTLRIAFVRLPDQMGPARLSAIALIGSAAGLLVIGLAGTAIGVYLGTAVFAVGIAFLYPALLAMAVARVNEMERGAVVGTTTAFLDLAFGLAPAALGAAVATVGLGGTFVISAVIAAGGGVVLAARRDAFAGVATIERDTLPG